MDHKGWVAPRPHKKPSGHTSPHQFSLGIPLRPAGQPAGLSLQIPTGLSPPKATNASTDDRVSASALERTKSLNEIPKTAAPELFQELYDKGKEVQHLTTQRDELRAKVSQLLDQIKPLRNAAQSAHEKEQTIEQLQEAILASKYEVASLRHQLGLYESTSKEICRVLEKGHLSKEDRVHVLTCIRNVTKDSHDLQSSRSSPLLVLDDTGEFEQLFTMVQRRESKGKLTGLKSPYRAPPASLTLLNRQYKGNSSVKRLKSPRAVLQSTRSMSPSSQSLDKQCQTLFARLQATLEGWRQAYQRKLVS